MARSSSNAGSTGNVPWPVRLTTALTFLTGIALIAQLLATRVAQRFYLYKIVPLSTFRFSRDLQLVLGFMILYFSVNLWRRKRVAWWVVLIASFISVFLNFEYTRIWQPFLLPLLLIGSLILWRDQFAAKSDALSIRRGFGLAVASLAAGLLYGTLGFWLLDRRDFGLTFSFSDAFFRTIRLFFLVGNTDLVPYSRHAEWFLDSLSVIGITSVAMAAYSLFRPIGHRFSTLPQERTRALGILAHHGHTGLDYFLLWNDKEYLFSDDGLAFLAYSRWRGVAMALGDPIGPPSSAAKLLKDFDRLCLTNSWRPVYLQTTAKFLPQFAGLNYRSFKVGEEALVDLDHFATITARDKDFRTAGNRFQKEGYSFEILPPPHDSYMLDQLKAVSDEWLSLPGRKEHSFSLGYFRRQYLAGCRLFVLRDHSGKVVAFANEVECFKPGLTTIDLMRHRLEAPNGTMDFLFLSILLQLHSEGKRQFSLGLAPLSGLEDKTDKSVEEWLVLQLFESFNQLFSFKGLRKYKEKFQPEWEDRYLVYSGTPKDLAAIALAHSQITTVKDQAWL